MEAYKIVGGSGLRGKVRISGAKNAVLPMLAACVLTGGRCEIHDCADLRDVGVMIDILRCLGARVRWSGEVGSADRVLQVHAKNLDTHEVPELLVRQMRSSIFLMGPMLGRLGRVRISYPGGCSIGPRPIDLHLRSLVALGAKIEERGGYIDASAERLYGADIHLDFPSVGATENAMMAAVYAQGTTVIRNVAKEPEIVDLQNFLVGMGARIRGAGLDIIRVEGTPDLGGVRHTAIPDRIETGTFMVAAAITRSEITIENCVPEHIEATLAKLGEAGVIIEEISSNEMVVRSDRRTRATDFKTLPYPGFATDMQPQVMALMSLADGTSVISENIFESRFKQAEELRRMGANIKTDGRTAIIKGVDRLFGARVNASDLRSGAALVLAGLCAEGETLVEGCHHIDRGYENLAEKFTALGANVAKVTEPVAGLLDDSAG